MTRKRRKRCAFCFKGKHVLCVNHLEVLGELPLQWRWRCPCPCPQLETS